MPINTTLDIVLEEDDLVVLGPPSSIDISVDVGAKGDRGGTVFNGAFDPNTVSLTQFNSVYGKTPVYGDLFLRIDYGTEYGTFYSYSTVPGGDQWVPILDLLQTMDLFFQYNDQAQDSFYSFVSACAIYGSASAIPQMRFDQNKRIVDIQNVPVNITTSQISNFQSSVASFLTNSVTSNIENGIGVTFDSNSNIFNFDVNDFTITLGNHLSGNVTINNLGNSVLNATVIDNSHQHIASNISDLSESVQDIVGQMISNNTESGINVTYDDSIGKLNFDVGDFVLNLIGDVQGSVTISNLGHGNGFFFDITPTVSITTSVQNDSHTHTLATISDIAESIEDVIGQMVTTNIENGISVTYIDNGGTNGKLNFDVNDFTITYTGDVSGTTTITNLGSTSTALTVVNDSHNHSVATIDNFSEQVQDVAAQLLNHSFHTNISATYDDANNRIYLVGQSELGGGGGGTGEGISFALSWWLGV